MADGRGARARPRVGSESSKRFLAPRLPLTSPAQRGDVDGVGLGLALVKEHVTIHGGRVWVEDKPDGTPGSRFVIALPSEGREDTEEMEALDVVEADEP